ncbi:MAG TPA: hypothetical protein VL426_01195 [Candidatus Binatia bacterium]|jgi:purine nucleoside phosphorylase|nr:hypothetical protein [Candidatus Binatia bacterium]
MRSPSLENNARVAAFRIRSQMGLAPDVTVPVGIILGTGWGDTLTLDDAKEVACKELPGFEKLGSLEGHDRKVSMGVLAGRTPAVLLRGRVHLNESHDPDHWKMVRLQTEMLLHLGVKTLVVTCGAGSLQKEVEVGDVVIIDGFVTAFAPPMPLLGGEFVSPEDALDGGALTHAFTQFIPPNANSVKKGGYAMLRGPQFEGRRYDKALLAATGAKAVGMSVLPEACVAALYPDVRVVPFALITNSAFEPHSHEENLRRSKERAPLIGDYLTRVVTTLPRRR